MNFRLERTGIRELDSTYILAVTWMGLRCDIIPVCFLLTQNLSLPARPVDAGWTWSESNPFVTDAVDVTLLLMVCRYQFAS